MYESESLVGERGQITIPKIIREKEGIKPKDKVMIKIENGRIVIEKIGKENFEILMKEYYEKYGKRHEEIAKEWEVTESEVNKYLDEY